MLRLVRLTGTAVINVLVGNVQSYEPVVKSALENQGWNISAVRITKSALAIFSSNVNIAIDANVDDSFSAEQARQNAVNVLTTIPGDSIAYYGSPLFTDVNLQVLSDSINPTANQDTTQQGNFSEIIKSVGDAVLKAGAGAVGDTAKNSSTPIAIAAVVIVGMLLILKRK